MTIRSPLPRELHRALLRTGWTLRVTGKGHLRYCPPPNSPDLRAVTIACSPSDAYRGKQNMLAAFRRQGISC